MIFQTLSSATGNVLIDENEISDAPNETVSLVAVAKTELPTPIWLL